MYKIILLLFFIVPSFVAFCQPADEIIMTVGNQQVQKEEFVRLYRKNNLNLMDNSEKKTPEEYLDLFINYKLKVLEAEELKLDTLQSFKTELKGYREELAKPYLTDVTYTEDMIESAYYRANNEVKASHILLRMDENASPKDTLQVYSRLMEIRKELMNGADFGELAEKYSEDPSAKQNRGLLGYFSGFQMVFPFENAAYNTPVGEISMPVRTRFGYHLIQVLDKRPVSGQIKVAHIMKRIPQNTSEETVNKLKSKMDSLSVILKQGADFAQLAREFSDDQRSAVNGGEMTWFSISNMLPEFAAPAFALKNDGDISDVIRTPYGWHIIKRLAFKPVPPLAEMHDLLVDKIKRNPEISKHSNEIFINKLKRIWDFKENEGSLQQFIKQAETAIQNGHLVAEKINNPAEVLFKYHEADVTFADFSDFLAPALLNQGEALTSQLTGLYNHYIAQRLLETEDEHLEEKHPDFKYLMQEYHDGILLFNLSEQKIWNKAGEDTVGLNAFYRKHKDKFLWDERFKGWVIQCRTQEVRDLIDDILSVDNQISKEELEDQVNIQFPDQAVIQNGIFSIGDNPLVDHLVWNEAVPENFKDGLHFVRGDKISPEPKTLQEARGQYISDYQAYLEKEWVKELRKKHKVKVNKKMVKTIEPV